MRNRSALVSERRDRVSRIVMVHCLNPIAVPARHDYVSDRDIQ